MKKVKTSRHHLKYLNFGKKNNLNKFLADYKEAVQFYIDWLWKNKFTIWNGKTFDLLGDQLNFPTFFPTKTAEFKTNLSARVLKSASTQALGIVKGVSDKRRKLLYVREKLSEQGKRTRQITKK